MAGLLIDWNNVPSYLENGKDQVATSTVEVVLLHEGHSLKQTDFLYLGFCIGVNLCRERNLLQGGSEEREPEVSPDTEGV